MSSQLKTRLFSTSPRWTLQHSKLAGARADALWRLTRFFPVSVRVEWERSRAKVRGVRWRQEVRAIVSQSGSPGSIPGTAINSFTKQNWSIVILFLRGLADGVRLPRRNRPKRPANLRRFDSPRRVTLEHNVALVGRGQLASNAKTLRAECWPKPCGAGNGRASSIDRGELRCFSW
jgi:hypothetical protein